MFSLTATWGVEYGSTGAKKSFIGDYFNKFISIKVVLNKSVGILRPRLVLIPRLLDRPKASYINYVVVLFKTNC